MLQEKSFAIRKDWLSRWLTNLEEEVYQFINNKELIKFIVT